MVGKRKRITEKTLKSKIYGNEPSWTDDSQPSPEKRNIQLAHSFQYFNQEFDKKKSWSFVSKWIRNHLDVLGLSKDDLKKIEAGFGNYFVSTIFSLMKCEDNGLVLNDSDIGHISNHLDQIIQKYTHSEEESVDQKSSAKNKKTLSPIERMQQKVDQYVIPELEGFYDELLKGVPKASFSLKEVLLKNDIRLTNSAMARPIHDWLEENNNFLDTIKNAKEGDVLLEYYSNYTRNVVNRLKRGLSTIPSQVDTTIETTKQKRRLERKENTTQRQTPRRKKAVDPSKLVSRFRFKKHDPDFSLESFEPEKIIGSVCVLLYNTKTRTLHLVQAPENQTLSVKGMAITGFDENTSFSYRLRKPQEVLPFAVKKTKLQVIKYLKSQLTTKEQKTKGRTSDDTIILRIFGR